METLRIVRPLAVVIGMCFLVVAGACASAAKKEEQLPETNRSLLGPAALRWASAEQPKEFVDFFAGTFTHLAVTVEETGESFTVHHAGDRFTFTPGISEDAEFTVPVKQENIDRMLTRAQDGKMDKEDATAIMRVMFTPLTRTILKHPVTSDDTLHKMSGVEDHIHVYLLDENGAEAASHTLTYRDGKWDVTEGIHGQALRTFRMNADQALEYQRRAYAAIRKNDMAGWNEFMAWYKQWREECNCSTVAKG